MNKYTIELIENKKLSYKPIYYLDLVKLETLKTEIKIYLKTRFIQSFKFFTSIIIFFNQNLNRSLCFYINN